MPRRELLQKGGAALAALALSPSFAMAASASDRKIRIGVVGGNFGRQFQWHEHPNCIVAAVSDLRPERRAAMMKTYRCDKSYESLEKLILDPALDEPETRTVIKPGMRVSVVGVVERTPTASEAPRLWKMVSKDEARELPGHPVFVHATRVTHN
jgi:hypothetical protein